MDGGLADAWPLFGLRLRVGRLELRLPTDAELVTLTVLAVAGVHEPGQAPFDVDWTRVPPPTLRRNLLRYHWRIRAEWSPSSWRLALGVFENGRLLGAQQLSAERFAARRTVETWSWLALAEQGRGVGSAMRTAVLALAFDGLGGLEARSMVFEDNTASLRLAKRLGYVDDGSELRDREGRPARMRRMVLSVDRWRAQGRPPVEIEGLESSRSMFGV